MNDRLTRLILLRTHLRPDATLGELHTPTGERICYTLEEPWRDNQRNISCIPEGEYPWTPKAGRKLPRWLLTGVPDRTLIEIHAGNSLSDISGCILVGLTRSYWSGEPVVLLSQAAINKLSKLIADHGILKITSKS
jgi:hypothetical protein